MKTGSGRVKKLPIFCNKTAHLWTTVQSTSIKKPELEKPLEQYIKESELLIYKVWWVCTFSEAYRQDLFLSIVVQLERQ